MSAFSIKNLRWAIYSYVADMDINKKIFNGVLEQLKAKSHFTERVIPLLLKGTRKVAMESDWKCTNCYYYGLWDCAGSHNGFCMNHLGSEDWYWMTFEEFKRESNRGLSCETFEAFELESKIHFKNVEEDIERLMSTFERVMTVRTGEEMSEEVSDGVGWV